MQNQQLKNWFYLFLFLHVAAWTLVPMLVRHNLPMDSIEGAIWGHQLEWGYDKNPFMNGWLTALATFLDGGRGWLLYFFCQISVAISMLAVWQLGKKIMPAKFALAAVLLLESIQYYNFHALDFNDNTLELSLWAMSVFCFYYAMIDASLLYWLLTGVLLALGMMTKYYTLALIAGLGLFLLRTENRWQLATLPPYLALLVFILMMVPHMWWLTQHQYITITYMFDRGSAEPSYYNHLFFPLQFLWQQFEAFLPALIIYLMLFIGRKPLLETPPIRVRAFDKAFLFYAGLLPFLLTALLSLVLGIKLRAGWGMPLMTFWTLWLFAMLAPRLTTTKIYSLLAGIFTLLSALLMGYSISIIHSADTSSANYPGTEIAAVLTQRWHNQYHQPLMYVAGPRWTAGNVAFYSPDHPAVFMEWDLKRSSWIKLDDMRKHGAIFIWEISNKETLPDEVKKAFPKLSQPEILTFDWQRNRYHLAPVKLGIAFLPPEPVSNKANP